MRGTKTSLSPRRSNEQERRNGKLKTEEDREWWGRGGQLRPVVTCGWGKDSQTNPVALPPNNQQDTV